MISTNAFLILGLTVAPGISAQQSGRLTLRPEAFVPFGGTAVQAEAGEILVPENRSRPGGRQIPIRFLRFPSRNPTPGAPIVYLAGGPGGSGIAAARGSRWPIFDALRDVADVIALDQRATGRSGSLPRCTTGEPVPLDQPTTRENLSRALERQVRHCRRWWDSLGVDLAAYNTAESAADLEDLRRALGVPRLDLWAISYGTQLALATMKHFPTSVGRAVLVSAEGLDEGAKSPAWTDGYLARVQASINQDPEARRAYPDVIGLMRRVITRLDSAPASVPVTIAGRDTALVLGGFEVRRLVADVLADPPSVAPILARFLAADTGNWGPLAARAQRTTGEPIHLAAMPLAMDAATGVGTAQRALIAREAPGSVLGDALGWPMLHAGSSLDDLDLGEAFRAPFPGVAEVLVISGTLDGRTYPEGHQRIAAMFGRASLLTVVNGGHNTVLDAPGVRRAIVSFLAGDAVPSARVVMPNPRWTPE